MSSLDSEEPAFARSPESTEGGKLVPHLLRATQTRGARTLTVQWTASVAPGLSLKSLPRHAPPC